MPKVLRILNRFNLGGPTYNAAYLTKYLPSEFETMLVGGVKDKHEDSSEYILENLGIKPVIIPEMRRSINPINDIIAYRKIVKIIKDFKPEIVHTHASKAGTIGRLAALRCKVPVIIHTFHGHVFHSYFSNYKTEIIKSVEHSLAKRSTKIIAISDAQKYELSEKYHITSEDKIKVIPLGFDLSRFREKTEEKRKNFRNKYHIKDDEIAIGIIGRLVPIKNHELFLNAVKYVKEKSNKKVRAFIIGDGESMNDLQQKTRELNIDFIDFTKEDGIATVTFTSWIKNIDTAYAGLDVVALTSRNEGTPVSLIEAQAANKPIVSTNVGGISNIVLPNQTALLTRNGGAEDYAFKLLNMVENDALRLKMTHAGWNYVKNKFHYSRLIEDMNDLYFSLLKN
ncbi:MAG: glycosyltransferase family 4 protein [Chlorobi bacterium]|nr:glycosyltransferase family 4 protein [Chlorobiota bacterium]